MRFSTTEYIERIRLIENEIMDVFKENSQKETTILTKKESDKRRTIFV